MRSWRPVDLLLLAVLSGYMVAGARLVPFQGNEAMLLHMSRGYGYLVIDRHPSRILFDDNWTPRIGRALAARDARHLARNTG